MEQSKCELSGILGALSDLRLARSHFKELIAAAHESSEVQYIPALQFEEDENGDLNTTLKDSDYKPQHIDFVESIEDIYSFKAPERHATNSLPRYPGFVICKSEYSKEVIKAADNLNSKIDAFKECVSLLGKQTFNYKVSKTNLLRRENVFDNENYELMTRPILRSENFPIEAMHFRWNCNHYSQPLKLTAEKFIEKVNNNALTDVKPYLAKALDAAKKLTPDTILVKRFYLPPTIKARFRYYSDEKWGNKNKWEKDVFPSTPLIVFSKSQNAKLKAKLPDLNVSIKFGTIIVNSEVSGRGSTPPPEKLIDELNWMVLR